MKRFKVLMLNGSPRENGNIALAFGEMQKVFEELNVVFECIQRRSKRGQRLKVRVHGYFRRAQ